MSYSTKIRDKSVGNETILQTNVVASYFLSNQLKQYINRKKEKKNLCQKKELKLNQKI